MVTWLSITIWSLRILLVTYFIMCYWNVVFLLSENVKEEPLFDIVEATTEDINKIIKSLNTNKVTGPNRILLKITRTVGNVIDSHLAYTINKDRTKNKFSENAKIASVGSIYKKNDRDKIRNHRLVSLLNGFSKMYERFLHGSLSTFLGKIFSKFVSAYRKSYSSNFVLLKLLWGNEEIIKWQKYYWGVVYGLV